MGVGTEILFMAALGWLLFGPKRLPGLGGLAWAKARLETPARSFQSHAQAELRSQHRGKDTNSFHEVVGDQ